MSLRVSLENNEPFPIPVCSLFMHVLEDKLSQLNAPATMPPPWRTPVSLGPQAKINSSHKSLLVLVFYQSNRKGMQALF